MNKLQLVVKTQLLPPKLGQNVLRRDRLLKILEHNLDKKLILVTAGAGYGKTTLLAQFVEELNTPFVFYTVSETNANLPIFLSYVITGIEDLYSQFGSKVKTLIESVDNVEMVMGTFINELLETIDEELFIILEDYHLVERTQEINKALDYLLERIPRNIHLVVSSRTVPPFSLAKLRAKANLLEILPSDLRFTSEEIKSLFTKIYKLNIPDSLLREIERRSEGWITVLQFVSHIIERNPDAVLDRMIYGAENLDYFASEVFDQQPENIRSFLIKSCILEQMTPDVCDGILGESNSHEMLEALVKKKLFISCVDERRNIFQYHPLFRHFLLSRLTRERGTAGLQDSLHLKAAKYFESIKDWENSITHYLLANDTRSASALLEREGESFVQARRFEVISDWLAKLPQDIVHENPTLLLYQADLYHWRGQFDKAIKVCNEVIAGEGLTPEHPVGWTYLNLGLMYALKGEFIRSKKSLREALRRHRIFNDTRGTSMTFRTLGFLNLMMGNYKVSKLYCERALSLNIKMRDKALDEQALHDISRACMLEGKFIEADEHISKIIPDNWRQVASGKGLFLITKGHIALELGEVEEAEKILKFALDEVSKSQSRDDLMLAHVVLSKLYYKKPDHKSTIKHLKIALRLCKERGYHFILLKLGKITTSLLNFAIKNGIEPHYAAFLLKEIEPHYDLRISFFGGLKIRTQDNKIVAEKWKRQKAKVLFCYLLANRGKSFTHDQLAELLWPGKSFSKAQSSLWQALLCIRETAKPFTKEELPFIERKSGCYEISPSYKIWLDFEELENLLAEARISEKTEDERSSINKYEAAITLYKGDFLVEMYEPWSEEKRLFYKEQYLQALDKISAFYAREYEFEKAIEYCRKAIALDKFREPAYLIAMRSHIALGNRSAALELYKKLEQILRDELNTEPSEEIKKLFWGLT